MLLHLKRCISIFVKILEEYINDKGNFDICIILSKGQLLDKSYQLVRDV